MSWVIKTAERVVQDTANVATTSGMPCAGIAQSLGHKQVIPTLRRVDDAVSRSRNELRRDVLPVQRKAELQIPVDDIANSSIGLWNAYQKGGWFTRLKLIPSASALERDATDLYYDIKRTSDLHAAHQHGAFTDPALHAQSLLELEGWVGVHVAGNDQNPPVSEQEPEHVPIADHADEDVSLPAMPAEAIPLQVFPKAQDETVAPA